MGVSTHYQPATDFESLGEGFFDVVQPATFPKAILRYRNQGWAERVGLGELTDEEWLKHFARFEPLPRNLLYPLALRYHGHQFRTYNPELGDGRGFLFAQLHDPADGRLLDLGTKGSGQTPYSRNGDGRLTLKGAVREALATEMLEMLGVYTSKTFSVYETGEKLDRQDEPSPTRSAVLVRLSHGHVRFGSFQRHAAYRDHKRLEALLDYVIARFFPHIGAGPTPRRAALLMREIAVRTAKTCASWVIAGFVHGVLNTDNLNVTGESFDYGPYRFLPTFEPGFTAAYFDQTGLYAFGRQPEACLWNLEQLASCFLLLFPEGESRDVLAEALNAFSPAFNAALVEKFFDQLGLTLGIEERERVRGSELLQAAYDFLFSSQVGYAQFFFDWYGGDLSEIRAMSGIEIDRYKGAAFEKFHQLLAVERARPDVSDRLRDPYFTRPRPCSLLIEEVEWIWEAIEQRDDWSRFEKKLEDIRRVRHLYGREQYATI